MDVRVWRSAVRNKFPQEFLEGESIMILEVYRDCFMYYRVNTEYKYLSSYGFLYPGWVRSLGSLDTFEKALSGNEKYVSLVEWELEHGDLL